jgi:hypothetical protein
LAETRERKKKRLSDARKSGKMSTGKKERQRERERERERDREKEKERKREREIKKGRKFYWTVKPEPITSFFSISNEFLILISI